MRLHWEIYAGTHTYLAKLTWAHMELSRKDVVLTTLLIYLGLKGNKAGHNRAYIMQLVVLWLYL